MKVSFEGIGEKVISFKNASAEKGNFVKMSASGTVAPCSAADGFVGVCLKADSDFADIQTAGYVECGYTDTAPSVGYATLVASTAGKVKTAQTGREYLVIKVDTANSVVGFII